MKRLKIITVFSLVLFALNACSKKEEVVESDLPQNEYEYIEMKMGALKREFFLAQKQLSEAPNRENDLNKIEQMDVNARLAMDAPDESFEFTKTRIKQEIDGLHGLVGALKEQAQENKEKEALKELQVLNSKLDSLSEELFGR